MNSTSAHHLLESIDQTIADIDSRSGVDINIDSYFAKFLVVFISGIYEEAIENILIDFTKKYSSQTEIVNYVSKSIRARIHIIEKLFKIMYYIFF